MARSVPNPARRSFVAAVLVACIAPTARAQGFLWRIDGDPSTAVRFGFRVACVGDVDDDGVDDVVITDPGANTFKGAFYIYSGASQALLGSGGGTDSAGSLGDGLAALDDVDGDGYRDFVITSERGHVDVYSARGASLLFSIPVPNTYVPSLANAGDVDQDGTSDIAFGDGMYAYVYSGKTGANLFQSGVLTGLAQSIDGAGDVDGDGVPDVLVGDEHASVNGTHNGHVLLDSGGDGSLIREIVGVGDGDAFGSLVRGGHDLDGDGVPDALVGNRESGTSPSTLFAYSGATGAEITRWSMDEVGTWDRNAAFAGDLDRDGVADVLLGSAPDGFVHVISGRTWTDLYRLPIAAEAIVGQGDVNGDGTLDVLVSVDTDGPNGAVVAYSGADAPAIASIQPDRANYRAAPTLTITGSGFASGIQLQVLVGAQAASNVIVVDFATLTCTVPSGDPGPCDIVVSNSLGNATAAGAFVRTPAVLLGGDPTPGGRVTIRHLLDPGDGVFSIVGVPPAVSIPTPPYDGQLCIAPFFPLVLVPPGRWPFTELDLVGDIPNDPALVGIQVLFQALIGPRFSIPGKDAAWSNCAVLTVQ